MASSEPILEVEWSKRFTNDLLHGLWEMKLKGEMTDFTIKVSNDVVPCHSAVMAAASPYFQRLLHTPMKESQTREVELVLDAEYVPKVVGYCYTGKITIGLSEAEVCLDIAEYFQLNVLKTKIEEFVCKQLSAEICISRYFLADKFSLDTLKKQSRSMMISDFKDVVTHIEFHQLRLTELVDYIQQVVIVTDSDVVLDACFNWVTYNVEARSESFLDILKHLRLDQCSQACMERVRKSWHPVWPNYAEIQEALDVQCSNTAAAPIAEADSKKLTAQIAGADSKKLVILLLGRFTETNVLNRKIWKINFASGQCDEIGQMVHYAAKYLPGYCATIKGLLVLGGSHAMRQEKRAPTTDCILLTLNRMQWKWWPDADSPIMFSVAVCIQNYIYTFTSKMVSCLNLNTKKWSTCPDIPGGIMFPIVAAIGEKLYVIPDTGLNEECRTSTKVPMSALTPPLVPGLS